MAKFQTKDGQEWQLEILAGHLKPLREVCEVDLREALKEGYGQFAEILSDPEKLMRTLWTLVEDQATERKVEPEAFARLFNGEAIRLAQSALCGATFDFFRGPAAATKAEAGLNDLLAKLDEQTGLAIGRELTRLRDGLSSGATVASSPEPSGESTTEPTPSAS